MKLINSKLFKLKGEEEINLTYNEAKVNFSTDYDIENPVTRSQALDTLMDDFITEEDSELDSDLSMQRRQKNGLIHKIVNKIYPEPETA